MTHTPAPPAPPTAPAPPALGSNLNAEGNATLKTTTAWTAATSEALLDFTSAVLAHAIALIAVERAAREAALLGLALAEGEVPGHEGEGPGPLADDAAAAAEDIPIGGLYFDPTGIVRRRIV